MGVCAVRTCKWVEILPMGVGAVRTCKEDSRSPETEPPPVRARRRSRHRSGPPPSRSEPGDGAAKPVGARQWGDGDGGPIGARRRSRHRSGPGDGAATGWAPCRAGRSPAKEVEAPAGLVGFSNPF